MASDTAKVGTRIIHVIPAAANVNKSETNSQDHALKIACYMDSLLHGEGHYSIVLDVRSGLGPNVSNPSSLSLLKLFQTSYNYSKRCFTSRG